jgi:hypothetical protein
LSCEHDEGFLKGFFDIVRILQATPQGGPDPRTVSVEDSFEGPMIPFQIFLK